MANQDLLREISSLNLGYSTPDDKLKNEFKKRLWSEGGKEARQYLIEQRGFNENTLKYFNIGLNDKGDIAIPVEKDGKLVDFKFRSHKEKKFYRHPGAETWIINEKGLEGVVRKEDGKKYLIITEGEFDAMSLWQLGFTATISGTGGAQGKADWILRLAKDINTIYICFDNDEPGQEAAQKLAERIGLEKCLNVKIPFHKDANEMLQSSGTTEEFIAYLKDAKTFKIKGVYHLNEILERLKNKKIERIPTFLPSFNKVTDGGVHRNSLVVLSGSTGIGKSTALLNFLVDHANNRHPVLLTSLENDLIHTIERILEIKYRKRVKDFVEEDWQRAKIELADYPFYIDASMDNFAMKDVENMVAQAQKLYGIEVFGFDHIHFIAIKGANVARAVNDLAAQFKLMARKHSLVVYLISHIRKIEKGKTISRDDLKDTSGLAQLADFVLFVKGGPEGHWLVIDKARMSRSFIKIPIRFNMEIGTVEEDAQRKTVDVSTLDPVIDREADEKTSEGASETDSGDSLSGYDI